MAKSRIVVMPFDCNIDAPDQILPASKDFISNHDERVQSIPSQNNNAKRTHSNFASSGSRPNSSPQDQEHQRPLFQRVIRVSPDPEKMDDEESREYLRSVTRAHLIYETDDVEHVPPRPPMSVGAIRLADLPHPMLKYRGNNIFGPSRKKEQDILEEWRNAGLIKEGGGGVAFEVALQPNLKYSKHGKHRSRSTVGPVRQRKRRTHRLTSLNIDDVKRKLEEKQRRASERRKRVQSAVKERISSLIHERKKQAKEKYEEEEDYKQRITHMKIIEKQSKCAVNREKQETEFRKKIEERRRRREKVLNRAKRPFEEETSGHHDHQRSKHDYGNSYGTPETSNDMSEDDTDEFVESLPRLP